MRTYVTEKRILLRSLPAQTKQQIQLKRKLLDIYEILINTQKCFCKFKRQKLTKIWTAKDLYASIATKQ